MDSVCVLCDFCDWMAPWKDPPPLFFPLPVPRCFWRSSTELTPATSAFVSHSSRLFFILNIFFYFLFFSLLLLPRLRNVLSRCAYTQSRKEKLNAPRSSNSWWCFIPEREGGGGESIASVSSQITRLVSNWPFQLKPVFFSSYFGVVFTPQKKAKKRTKKQTKNVPSVNVWPFGLTRLFSPLASREARSGWYVSSPYGNPETERKSYFHVFSFYDYSFRPRPPASVLAQSEREELSN